MPDYLVDTGPLIRHLRHREDATQLLSQLARIGKLYISAISRTEIVRGMRDDQRAITYELFDSVRTLPIDAAIADLAGTFLRHYRKEGVTLNIPDTLFAATAVIRSLTLVTYNRKDYPMPELRLADLP